MADISLADRVDDHFRNAGLALHDTSGMMRHILDSLGALKYRLGEDDSVSPALVTVFGNAVKIIIDSITGFEDIDTESAVGFLVSAFPDPNKKRDGRGWLPLHWAAAIHNTETEDLRAIIKERPIAASKGHLHYDADGEERSEEVSFKGLLPIHLACSLKHPTLANIQTLVHANPNTLGYIDHRGWSPVHWCAYNCRVPEIMKFIIRRNPDSCYIANKKGKLPFQMAAINRCVDMFDLLYEENPEAADGLDYNGNSPMHDAAKSFNYEAIHKLYQLNNELCRGRNFKEQLPIHKAFGYIAADATRLQYRHLETIKALLRYSPETASLPDAQDSLPLHLAVFYHSSIEVCTEIYNVYPSAALVRDNQGKLPIQYVNNAEVKKLLMKSSPPLVKAGITDSFSRFVTNS